MNDILDYIDNQDHSIQAKETPGATLAEYIALPVTLKAKGGRGIWAVWNERHCKNFAAAGLSQVVERSVSYQIVI